MSLYTPYVISSAQSQLSVVHLVSFLSVPVSRIGFSQRSYPDQRRCVTLESLRDIIGRSYSFRGGV